MSTVSQIYLLFPKVLRVLYKIPNFKIFNERRHIEVEEKGLGRVKFGLHIIVLGQEISYVAGDCSGNETSGKICVLLKEYYAHSVPTVVLICSSCILTMNMNWLAIFFICLMII